MDSEEALAPLREVQPSLAAAVTAGSFLAIRMLGATVLGTARANGDVSAPLLVRWKRDTPTQLLQAARTELCRLPRPSGSG